MIFCPVCETVPVATRPGDDTIRCSCRRLRVDLSLNHQELVATFWLRNKEGHLSFWGGRGVLDFNGEAVTDDRAALVACLIAEEKAYAVLNS